MFIPVCRSVWCSYPPVDTSEAVGHEVADARQEDQHQRQAEQGVDDGDQAAGGGARHDVAVAQGGDDAEREEQRLGERPVVWPALHAAVVVVLGDGADDLRLHHLQGGAQLDGRQPPQWQEQNKRKFRTNKLDTWNK